MVHVIYCQTCLPAIHILAYSDRPQAKIHCAKHGPHGPKGNPVPKTAHFTVDAMPHSELEAQFIVDRDALVAHINRCASCQEVEKTDGKHEQKRCPKGDAHHAAMNASLDAHHTAHKATFEAMRDKFV